MTTSANKLKTEMEDCILKCSHHGELRGRIKTLCETDAQSKQYLGLLKEVLQSVPLPNDCFLKMLVSLYLSLHHKNAAKKCVSSFFQNLQPTEKKKACGLFCQKMMDSFEAVVAAGTISPSSVRELVDNVTALMDNFPLGEDCISSISSSVVIFLSRAQSYFLQLFRMPGQSAMTMNSIMHSCHVTMQALNRLLQRHAPEQEEIKRLQSSACRDIISANIQILLHEQMMADCRCCCAINMVLLLSLSDPGVLVEITRAVFRYGEMPVRLPEWLQNIGLPLKMANLSPMAALCLLWGFVSMLPSETLTLEVESLNDLLVFEVMLNHLLKLDEMCASTSSRAQAAKTVTLWTTRMCDCLENGDLKKNEKGKMTGNGSTIRQLLSFVWTHWQDLLEIVRLNSRITFNSCLKMHLLASTNGDPSDDPFLLSLLKQVLGVSWHNPSKFGVLGSLVQCIGSEPVLRLHASFPSTLLQQIQDQGVACHVSDLYEKMMNADKAAKCHSGCQTKARMWLKDWLSPLILALCGSNKKLKQHIIEYLLPRILKDDKTVLEFLLSELAVSGKQYCKHGSGHLGALIVCLRRARAIGLLAWPECGLDNVSGIGDRVCDALGSPDEQVRLDTLALLCENKKTTAVISLVEFDYLKHFISHNLNNQSPAFRQAVLSSLKKLFFRINESYAALRRKKKKSDLAHIKPWSSAEGYHLFLGWLEEHLFDQLYPGAAFARRMMSLNILSLLVQEIRTAAADGDGYQPLRKVSVHHLHTLLECLTDTYEENKHEAFKLLLASTSMCPDLLSEEHCKALFSCALRLATSTRPQDGSTAACLFRFLLQQSCISSVISAHRLELQNLAHVNKLLQTRGCLWIRGTAQLPSDASSDPEGCLQESSEDRGCNEVVDQSNSKHLQAEYASFGKTLLHSEVMQQSVSCSASSPECQPHNMNRKSQDRQRLDGISGQWVSEVSVDVPTVLRLLQVLLTLLADEVAVAECSLVVAAANRPMHPTLHSIRCILSDVDLGAVDERFRAVWSDYINCLLQTCLQVAKVVSPVVQNSSPEGNVPQEAILGPGLNFDTRLLAEVEDSQQTVILMPEYLVVCSWRSIKEVSLLLGHLCLNAPATQPGVSQGLIALQQVEDIGSYFKQQLMESLHRGAFELAYAGFVMMCQMLWRSSWSQLQQLPQQWLREVMAAVVADDQAAALCATRRSAGVPFFLQAILGTESTATGRPSFHQVMRQLLDIAFSSSGPQSSGTDKCVHALNILRALFKDTRLADDVALYISDGLMAAVSGFKSQYWEIRNSATLLLSALITRIFGVKRNRDDSVLSKRNSQTGRAFFYKYPALFQFLLTELETATQSHSKGLHLSPSLYPVLMVLGRLFPSTMEEDATHLNLASFVPHIIKCASSPVYKTRVMAAQALQPLVSKDQICLVLTTLLGFLRPEYDQRKLGTAHSHLSHSHMHGVLLQVYHLLLLLPDVEDDLLQKICHVCLTGLQTCTWLLTRENKCLLTRKVAMEVADQTLSHADAIKTAMSARDLELLRTIQCLFLTTLRSEVKDKASGLSPCTPFLADFLACVGFLAMKWLTSEASNNTEQALAENTVVQLLNFDAYEVRIAVLDSLLVRSRKSDSLKTSASEDSDNLVSDDVIYNEKKIDMWKDNEKSGHVRSILTKPVVNQLLHLGLDDKGHPETVMKVFHVLLSAPNAYQCISDQNVTEVLNSLLQRVQLLKRSDVKASLMEFCSSFVPFLLKHLHKTPSTGLRKVVCQLKDTLLSWCQSEQPEELQLTCARILLSHAPSLLVDKDGCLGVLVFDFWTMVVYLLQADDLEVKEVAAKVTAKLSLSSREGGTHPEQAVPLLVTDMFSLHGKVHGLQCLSTVLNWLHKRFTSARPRDYQDSSQHLFDKGELNTFQDEVAFTRVVAKAVKAWTVHTGEPGLVEKDSTENETCQSGIPKLVLDAEETSSALKAITYIISEITSSIARIHPVSTDILFLETFRYNEDVQFLIYAGVVAHIIKCGFVGGEFRDCHVVELAYEQLLLAFRMCLDKMTFCNCLLKKVLKEL